MLPVVAIVGRPNVGKSTLFNQLTGTRDAIVADRPGLTRDRRYGTARRHGGRFIVVDTGGLGGDPEDLASQVGDQVRRALDEADRIVFMTDARAGRTAADDAIADRIRRLGKPIVLAVNKTDGLDERTALLEFHALGLAAPTPISAAHGRGLSALVRALVPDGPRGAGGTDEAEAAATATPETAVVEGGRGGRADRDPRPAERREVHPRQPPARRGSRHYPRCAGDDPRQRVRAVRAGRPSLRAHRHGGAPAPLARRRRGREAERHQGASGHRGRQRRDPDARC